MGQEIAKTDEEKSNWKNYLEDLQKNWERGKNIWGADTTLYIIKVTQNKTMPSPQDIGLAIDLLLQFEDDSNAEQNGTAVTGRMRNTKQSQAEALPASSTICGKC